LHYLLLDVIRFFIGSNVGTPLQLLSFLTTDHLFSFGCLCIL
jgi:hypothetical protein